MEKFKVELNNGNEKLIEYVAKKFNYNDELINILKSVVSVVLKDASSEETNNFFEMLKKTPIIIIPANANIKKEDLIKKFMSGNNGIDTIDEESEEIILSKPDGAFISEPIFDNKMNVIGSKKFIFVKKYDLSSNKREVKDFYKVFETDINVPQLVQEICHAWVSEDVQYKFEGDILIKRIGVSTIKYKIEKNENESHKRILSRHLRILEEALNMYMSQGYLSKMLDISQEDLGKLYEKNGLLMPSEYNGIISDLVSYFIKNTSEKDIRKWRFFGDENSLKNITQSMEKTKEFEYRSYKTDDTIRKINLFKNPVSEKSKKLFLKYQEDFFPNKEEMTPIEIFNNILLQCYDIVKNREVFDISKEEEVNFYKQLLDCITSDGYIMTYQTSKIMNEKYSV